jgi:hypothetical protein
MAREGERVHAATLFFDVDAEIPGGQEAVIELAPDENWLAIHHVDGLNEAGLPVTVEVEPLLLGVGVLLIQREPTYRGDANFDYKVDVSDAITILGEVFLGAGSIYCRPAADFNRDGRVNISDPIAILQYLFRSGDPAALEADVFCDA